MKKSILTVLGLFLIMIAIGQEKQIPSADKYLPNKMIHAKIVTQKENRVYYKVGNSIYSTKPNSAETKFTKLRIKTSVAYEVMTAVKAKGSYCDISRLGKRVLSISPDYPIYPEILK